MKNCIQTRSLLAALATIVFTFSSAQAGTIWDGGGADTNINTAANWDDNLVPTLTAGNQTLTFGTAGASATINTDVNVSGLVFNRDANFALNSGAGNLTIGTGGITNNATAITASRTYTINEGVILNGNQTWSVNNKNGTILGALTVGGVVSGSSAITKTGNGTLTLSGNNTYSGGTILRGTGSRITVTHISGLGSGNVTIESTGLPSASTGAFVALNTNGIYANNFTISGQGTANGAIQGFASNATLSGLVTLAGDAMIATRTTAGNGKLFVTGGITSGGTNRTLTLNAFGNATVSGNELTISTNSVNLGSGGTLDIGHGIQNGGSGTFNINVGGNTWGTTIVRGTTAAGNSTNTTLNLGAANALGSSILQLGNTNTALEGATVNLNGNSQTIGGLRSFAGNGSVSANGTRTITSATAATLTIDNSSGTNYLYDGVISGNVSLTKSGSATQTLSGNSTYTGGTTLAVGTLILAHDKAAGTAGIVVSGSSAATLRINSGITIANNITFSNTNAGSVVNRSVANSTAYTVGTSGSLTSNFADGTPDTTASILAGTNTQGSTATLAMKFASASGATNDGIRRSDVFSLTGTSTNAFVLQLSFSGLVSGNFLGWLDTSNNTWANAVSGNTGAGSLAGAYNTSFATFLANNGGIFNGTTMLGAYGVDTTGGSAWAVLDHNSDFAVIPEPSTWALLAASLTTVMILRRRRRE